jgi:hypothetical protein
VKNSVFGSAQAFGAQRDRQARRLGDRVDVVAAAVIQLEFAAPFFRGVEFDGFDGRFQVALGRCRRLNFSQTVFFRRISSWP